MVSDFHCFLLCTLILPTFCYIHHPKQFSWSRKYSASWKPGTMSEKTLLISVVKPALVPPVTLCVASSYSWFRVPSSLLTMYCDTAPFPFATSPSSLLFYLISLKCFSSNFFKKTKFFNSYPRYVSFDF